MYDILIKGGSVIDGTGQSEQFIADIAIKDGVIVEVGQLDGAAASQTIDASGALVTPGWVDSHTHYDGQVTWDDALEGSAMHGVTTVVMGNCGVGFAPVRRGRQSELINLMEGVEDIPGTALYEGIPWGAWEGFPEYLAYLGERSWSMDICAQIPHAPLRYYVMGDRALHDRDATEDEVARMAILVEEAVRAGAIGFSTSRCMGHRAMSGEVVPGTYAPEDELLALASAVAKGGGGVLQVVPASVAGETGTYGPEQSPLSDEIRMYARISRKAGIPVTFTTLQPYDNHDGWRDALSLVADENKAGAQIFPMVAPRASTVLTSLQGYHLFMRRPSFMRLTHLPLNELASEMQRPEIKAAILSEQNVPDERPGSMQNALPSMFEHGLHLTYPLREPLDYEPRPEESIAGRAKVQGVSVYEALYDFLIEDEGRAVGVWFGANYLDGNLDACREMLLDPHSVSGLSDAGAHVGFICDYSAPTFHLTHWTRDRVRGPRLPIEQVVAKCTSMPARVFGLTDRGVIQVGKRADINVIDYDALSIGRPELRHDLPAGGARYLQPARGYLASIAGGVLTRDHDSDTGARPGSLAHRIG